jgi:hypothetical protein
MSVEERRTEPEALKKPPPERKWTALDTKESLREGCDQQTPGQPLKDGEGKPPIEKKHGDKLARECRTIPQQGSDDSAVSESDRKAQVCSDRRNTSDERVTSHPRPRKAQEISRGERRLVREWSDGRSSEPPEHAEGPLRAQAALPQSVRNNLNGS